MSKIPTNIKLSFIIVIIIIFLKPLTNHLIIIGLAYLLPFFLLSKFPTISSYICLALPTSFTLPPISQQVRTSFDIICTNPFLYFSFVDYVLLDSRLTINCCKVWFWYSYFITNLSTAARQRQGWYQRLFGNGRVESLFLILVSFVCSPGLPAMCLLTQVLYIVCVMSTSSLNLINFYSNFCSSHPTT